jgi:hypothetical protein
MAKGGMNRKSQTVAKPTMWKRSHHYRRAVFMQRKDKKGRTFIKTPGGLRRADFMKNKRGKIVSKRQHARGIRTFVNIQHIFEARQAKIKELGLTGFIKAHKNGTAAEKEVFKAMTEAQMQHIQNVTRHAKKHVAAAVRYESASEAEAASSCVLSRDVSEESALPEAEETTLGGDGGDSGKFAPGDEVIINGLVSDSGKEFNGKRAIVMSFGQEQEGRYALRVKHPEGVDQHAEDTFIHVKPSHLAAV